MLFIGALKDSNKFKRTLANLNSLKIIYNNTLMSLIRYARFKDTSNCRLLFVKKQKNY